LTAPANALHYHATALVVGTTGFLVTGPSGGGKSALALRLISKANAKGLFARLVADDQVLLEPAGGRLVAFPPPSIAGLIECRGSGVFPVPHLERARMHYALAPGAPKGADRVPPADERLEPVADHGLPVIRLLYQGDIDPLATLEAILVRF
jgi:hypothetical protein